MTECEREMIEEIVREKHDSLSELGQGAGCTNIQYTRPEDCDLVCLGAFVIRESVVAGFESRQARIVELEDVLKKIPVVKAMPNHLGWACSGCGSRSGMTLGGVPIDESCVAGCWVMAAQLALDGR